MAETPVHKLRFPETTDPDTLAAYYQHLAEDVELALDAIAPSQLIGGAAGQLIIVDGTGAGAYKAMTGDGTIDAGGSFQLGAGVVGTTELADAGVVTSKVDDEAITLAKLVEAVRLALLPAGALIGTLGEIADPGFLMVEGQTNLSTAKYPNLFAKVGYRYGGSGSEFGLPNGRGRFFCMQGAHTDVNELTDNDGMPEASRTPKHKHEKGTLAVGADDRNVNIENGASGLHAEPADREHSHPVTGSTATAAIPYFVGNYMVKY